MAHHQPMFNRPVVRFREVAIDLAGWICPVTRDWVEDQCGVLKVLAERP